jgi:molecular chaperone GrpE
MAKRKQKNETVAEKVDHTEIETKTAAAAQVESGAEETVTEALEAEKTVDAAEGKKNAEAESSEAIAEVEAEAAETEPEPDLTEQLELARQEAAQNLDGWQRAAAELANFKRRQEEQLKLQRDRIKGEVLEGVISALDDLDLAFQNVPEEIDGQLVGWVEGFRLVQRKLNKVLDDQNVMLINTDGEFDPNVHEAVSHEESEDHNEGQIIGELRKGYQIGSRVLRPALVRVAK